MNSVYETHCDSFTWINNQTYYTDTVDSMIFSNNANCDSTIVLNLFINQSTSHINQIFSCDPYQWLDGNTYSSSNNQAQIVLTNQSGCDSIVTLDLTIPIVDTGISIYNDSLVANAIADSYQWLLCDSGCTELLGATMNYYNPLQSGSYAVKTVSEGCTQFSACYAVEILTGIEPNPSEQINIYPNPTSGNVTVQCPFDPHVEILNALGEVVIASYRLVSINFKTCSIWLEWNCLNS